MDVDVTARAVILRPRAEVAAFAADPASTPKWQTHLKAVDREATGPLTVGEQFALSSRFFRFTTSYSYEVVEYLPGEVLVMRSVVAGNDDDELAIALEMTYTWESLGPSATHMVVRSRGTMAGTFTLMTSPIMHMIMRVSAQRDLNRLKKLLERV